jgi:hypothetical protein
MKNDEIFDPQMLLGFQSPTSFTIRKELDDRKELQAKRLEKLKEPDAGGNIGYRYQEFIEPASPSPTMDTFNKTIEEQRLAIKEHSHDSSFGQALQRSDQEHRLLQLVRLHEHDSFEPGVQTEFDAGLTEFFFDGPEQAIGVLAHLSERNCVPKMIFARALMTLGEINNKGTEELRRKFLTTYVDSVTPEARYGAARGLSRLITPGVVDLMRRRLEVETDRWIRVSLLSVVDSIEVH